MKYHFRTRVFNGVAMGLRSTKANEDVSGADPLVRAGPPGPALRASSIFSPGRRGVGCGPAGPPLDLQGSDHRPAAHQKLMKTLWRGARTRVNARNSSKRCSQECEHGTLGSVRHDGTRHLQGSVTSTHFSDIASAEPSGLCQHECKGVSEPATRNEKPETVFNGFRRAT
jgi:hypothetical protein